MVQSPPLFITGLVALSAAVTAPLEAEPERPVVLMVRVGEATANRGMETRFVTELSLYIEGFAIQEIPAPTGNFVDVSINKQVGLIKPAMKERRAVAAMWLHTVSDDVLLLHVVVLDTGRALVRLFEHSLLDGSEEALAATAAELLGTAYLFDGEKSARSKPLEELVSSTREQAAVASRAESKWRIDAAGLIQSGRIGAVGPSLRAGGLAGAERSLPADLFLRLLVQGTAGPLGRNPGDVRSGSEAAGAIQLLWAPRLGKVRWGPFVHLSGGLGMLRLERPGLETTDYMYGVFSGGLGTTLRLPLHEEVSLSLGAGVEAMVNRLEVKLRSSAETIQKMGQVRAFCSVGVLLF